MERIILIKAILFLAFSTVSKISHANMTLYDIQRSYEKNKNELVVVKQINHYFNQFQYQEDITSRGKKDYWKTPLEFLEDNGGDCEDFAIIKYFHLKSLGIPAERLRLFYVVTNERENHIVLAYYQDGSSIPILLDNMRREVVSAKQRKDLQPIFSFNFNTVWVNKTFDSAQKAPIQKTSKFEDVLNKMKKENNRFFK